MKKQKKQLIYMLAVLLFLIAAYFGLELYNNQLAEEEQGETIYITSFSSQEICAFSYDYEEQQYSFTKTEDVWSYDGDTSVDLDESEVESLILKAGAIIGAEALTEYESPETYGLESPQKTVTFTLTDGTVMTIKIGDYNDMLGYYYLMIDGKDILYMADSTLLDIFDVSYEDWIYVEEVTEDTEVTEELEDIESTELE